MKAYFVSVSDGLSSVVVFAPTGAKARWIAVHAAREAGYEVPWARVWSLRMPDSDQYYHEKLAGRCINVESLVGQFEAAKR